MAEDSDKIPASCFIRGYSDNPNPQFVVYKHPFYNHSSALIHVDYIFCRSFSRPLVQPKGQETSQGLNVNPNGRNISSVSKSKNDKHYLSWLCHIQYTKVVCGKRGKKYNIKTGPGSQK